MRGSVRGLRPPGLEFPMLCLEGSVISFISPSSGGSPDPVLAFMCTQVAHNPIHFISLHFASRYKQNALSITNNFIYIILAQTFPR